MGPVKLSANSLRKVYPGTVALDGVSLNFRAGEVHALLGKNGAGKSTLVKILAGAVAPTGGELRLDGRPVRFDSPAAALRAGIATVYQELSVIPELSVAENILLGRLPGGRGASRGLVSWNEIRRRAAATLERMQTPLDVRAAAGRLSVAKQQVVEIARAMSFEPGVLLLDEPTSALAAHEVQQLFRLVRQLARRGVAIIYITHRLSELREIADVGSVLRDGRLVGTYPIAELTPARLAESMFGAIAPAQRPERECRLGPPVLDVRGLRAPPRLAGVDLSLRPGEVLGIAGMLGAGRTELLKAVFGELPIEGGEIRVAGRVVSRPTPRRMKALGVALAPEDRKRDGLVLDLSVRDNVCLAALNRIGRRGLISKGRQRRIARQAADDLQIALADVEQPVGALSGGNQQKVILANWLHTQPRVMLLDEPTRGIDVQAKQQIFRIIWDLSRRGIATLFVSSELEELLEVCDRIVVLRHGRITAELRPENTGLDQLLAACMEGPAS